MSTGLTRCGARFSPDRRHRYALWRLPEQDGMMVRKPAMFIGLNPSTATETDNDPTVRRCINFASSWGYGGLIMTNAYALRATDPKNMKASPDPVGPDNDSWLLRAADYAGIVIAAWGVNISTEREEEIKALLQGRLHNLDLTKAGHPKHPLYLRADTGPREWC